MILSKFKRKAMSAALVGVMGLSMCSPVLAMASEGDIANSNITIEAEASSINVTVPTNAAFVFKGDGTNVYPSNYEVTNNNALTAITLNSIDFEGVNGWKLTTEDDTFQADQKKFALWMGARGNELSAVDVNDGVVFTGDTEIKITPNGSKILDFQAKRGVFSTPVTTENAMQMTMHFDWEHAEKKVATNAYFVEGRNYFDELTVDLEEKTAYFVYTTGGSNDNQYYPKLTFNGQIYSLRTDLDGNLVDANVGGDMLDFTIYWGDLKPGTYPIQLEYWVNYMGTTQTDSATLVVEE